MKKFNMKSGVALLLAVVMLLGLLAGCGEKPATEPTTPTTNELTGCTVQVTTEGGKALEGVGVYIYADADKADMVDYVKTDANGIATITAAVPEGAVAVLDKVPEGYVAQENYAITEVETKISLQIQLRQEMGNVSLGDVMFDFTVTDIDGVSHTLSELLQTKKAVALNFWFVNCNPCRDEFPYLVEAYIEYFDDVEVLAINPEDDDVEAIANFVGEVGLTFPTVKGEESWKEAFALQMYPTTVIIDRFGTVGLIHIGSIDNAKVFKDAFAYFTSDDYVQSTVADIKDVEVEEQPAGTQESPEEFMGVTEFEITVKPGEDYYCNLYRVSGMDLTVESQTLKVTLDETVAESVDGIVSMQLPNSIDPFSPFTVCFTNTGAEEETYKIVLTYPAGTMENPLALELGNVKVDVAEGNAQGVYLTYTAEKNGNLTLRGLQKESGYNVAMYNLTTFVQKTLEEDAVDGALTIEVATGDEIQILVTSNFDDEGNYPATTVSFVAEAGENANQPSGGETPTTEPTEETWPVVSDPTVAPTEPVATTKPTAAPTKPTEAPTKPTKAPTKPTEAPTKPTEAPTKPATEPTTVATLPVVTMPIVTLPVVTTPAEPNYNGTLVNPDEPVDQFGFNDFTIDVGAGEKKLIFLSRIFNVATLCISDKDAYVVYGGTTYKPDASGNVYVRVEGQGTFTPTELHIGNSGGAAKTFDVKFYFDPGTQENPIELKLGTNVIETKKGDELGVYHTFKASKAGTLTITVKGVDPDKYACGISVNDMQEIPTVVELEEGSDVLTIELPAGATAEVIFSVIDPVKEWNHPAAKITVEVTFK